MVEIAKVLRIEQRTKFAPVIILDEPTSVLESGEVETLFTQIRRLREFASVIFVSHRLDEVLEVCDRVTVLRGGQSVGDVPTAGAVPGDLHRLMIGSTGSDDHYHDNSIERPPAGAGTPAHRARPDAARRSATSTWTSPPGRSWRSSASTARGARTCAARCSVREETLAGEVTLDGKKLDLSGTRAACSAGVGYVPAERKIEGMVGPMSVADNMTLTKQGVRCAGPLVMPVKQASIVDSWI